MKTEKKVETTNAVESDEIFTASQAARTALVPKEIEARYVKVNNRYYQLSNPKLVAFEDKGNRLETKADSPAIAQSLVRIAEARGWDEIKVAGTEIFRREVWLEAMERGMTVKGYKPSEQDKAALAARAHAKTNSIEEGGKASVPKAENEPGPLNLVAHGAAKYLHDEKNSDSYYVTTQDQSGTEKTVWGVDLQRAIQESGAQSGDKIFIKYEGKKPVTVLVPIRDEQGREMGEKEILTHRNSWNVTMAETFATKPPAEAVKEHPELAGAVAALDAIDKKAKNDGLTVEQREIVMRKARARTAEIISEGKVPEVRIRKEIQRSREAHQEQEQSR